MTALHVPPGPTAAALFGTDWSTGLRDLLPRALRASPVAATAPATEPPPVMGSFVLHGRAWHYGLRAQPAGATEVVLWRRLGALPFSGEDRQRRAEALVRVERLSAARQPGLRLQRQGSEIVLALSAPLTVPTLPKDLLQDILQLAIRAEPFATLLEPYLR